MALSEEIKEALRIHICKKSRNGFGAITPAILKEYASKTDDEIIALLAAEKATEIANLIETKSKIETRLSELQAE